MRILAICLLALALHAQSAEELSLREFLQTDLGPDQPELGGEPTRYFQAFVDLNGDGKKEAIVYVTGRLWCGTGGCNTWVLARKGSGWNVVSTTTITRPPIRVLKKTSNGWHSLAVYVVGGGIQPGYEAELPFDGGTYPTNPSVPPALKTKQGDPGKVVIPDRPWRTAQLLH